MAKVQNLGFGTENSSGHRCGHLQLFLVKQKKC